MQPQGDTWIVLSGFWILQSGRRFRGFLSELRAHPEALPFFTSFGPTACLCAFVVTIPFCGQSGCLSPPNMSLLHQSLLPRVSDPNHLMPRRVVGAQMTIAM